jgi:hypothetical protein
MTTKESGMSDRDLAAAVEDLRTRQERTDESLVALIDAITSIIDSLEAQALLVKLSVNEELTDVRDLMTAVKQFHRSDREP